MKKKKKIIVFGAGGFIGTYLIDQLYKEGFNITASDINPSSEKHYSTNEIKYVSVDITNESDFEKFNSFLPFDVVINLAAMQPANYSIKNNKPSDYIDVNVLGTLNILNFCKKNQIKKFIQASSHRNTQGLWTNNKPIGEQDGRSIKFSGQYSMFSISESCAQDCIEYYRVEHNLKSIIFRLPPVYGYGPHLEIFSNGKPIKTGFQIFVENAMACKPIEIWGNPDKGRDIIYIKDVVAAFTKAIENDNASGLYNIASGKLLTLREEAALIAKVFWGEKSTPVIIEKADIPNSIDSFVYDISKAQRELNWQPKFNFEDILIDYKKMIENKRFEFLIEKRKSMFKGEHE